jgi:hypothetical protein
MELVITHQNRLIHKHGPEGWAKIEAALDRYLDVLNASGTEARLELLDSALAPSDDLASETKATKRAILNWTTKSDVRYLLILGGDDIVRFWRIPDKTADRLLDKEILSDSYYADFDENPAGHFPVLGVGRLPDAAADGGELIAAQLDRATDAHASGTIPWTKSAGFSTCTWFTASQITYGRIDPTLKSLSTCPPWGLKASLLTGVDNLVSSSVFPAGCVSFFNLHGHPREPRWWGEQRVSGFPVRSPDVIDLSLMKTVDWSGAVLFCEACHGASVAAKTADNSLALCALARGAMAFFGCTASSYAVTAASGKPHTESGIDVLFNHILFRLIKKKACFGDAITEAKQYCRFLNDYDEKNIYGLVLLGDPMLRLG